VAPNRSARGAVWIPVVAVVLTLLVAEVVVRVFDLGPDLNVVSLENLRLSENPTLRYELAPTSRDGRFRISSIGLRDREYAPEKPAGTVRILIIGDSIAYGFGVAQNETLAKHLEEVLTTASAPPRGVRARAGADGGAMRYEVLNLGVSGYNVTQVVETLRVRGPQLAPDLVVWAYCLNDPQAYSFELETLRSELSDAALSYRDALLRRSRRWTDRSRLVMLARFAIRSWTSRSAAREVLPDTQWTAIGDGSYDTYFAELYEEETSRVRLEEGLADLVRIAAETGVPILTW